jgi:hypothetical protein
MIRHVNYLGDRSKNLNIITGRSHRCQFIIFRTQLTGLTFDWYEFDMTGQWRVDDEQTISNGITLNSENELTPQSLKVLTVKMDQALITSNFRTYCRSRKIDLPMSTLFMPRADSSHNTIFPANWR